jgi:hypothetical protein
MGAPQSRRRIVNSLVTNRRTWCAVIVALLIAAPAFAETVKGSGVMRSEARTVPAFSGVGLGIPARVEVRLGRTDAVTVEADDNLLPLIETAVQRGTLEIKPARRDLKIDSTSIKVVVQARQIDHLAIGGSGAIVADALRSPKLRLAVGGSGSIDVRRADCEHVTVEIGGSGNAKVAGLAKKLSIEIGGAGTVSASGLLADDVGVTIAGSGGAAVAARNTLDVTIAGSGDIRYYGDPKVSQTIVGSGHVRRVGALPQ